MVSMSVRARTAANRRISRIDHAARQARRQHTLANILANDAQRLRAKLGGREWRAACNRAEYLPRERRAGIIGHRLFLDTAHLVIDVANTLVGKWSRDASPDASRRRLERRPDNRHVERAGCQGRSALRKRRGAIHLASRGVVSFHAHRLEFGHVGMTLSEIPHGINGHALAGDIAVNIRLGRVLRSHFADIVLDACEISHQSSPYFDL